MKIAIDASQIVFKTGVSFYTSNLLKGLSKIDKKNEYSVFASSFRGNKVLKKTINSLNLEKNFTNKLFTLPLSYFEIFWNRMHLGNIESFLGKIDIFHASDWIQPPVKQARVVTTIHDLAVYKYPELFPPRILVNQKLRLKWLKKEADAVIAVSESTKKDIIKYLEIDPKKIFVIYEAVPTEHQVKADKSLVKKIKQKLNLNNYLLFVGTLEPRKNLKNVIKAFKLVVAKHPDLKLVVVGKTGWKVDKSKYELEDLKPNIKFIEQADDKQLCALYAGAICLLYPSLYEGFGLPILEAINQGCPVVASNISSMPEIAGNAGLLVDPKKISKIATAVIKILESKSLREKLINLGYKQLNKFSWEKTARQTLEVYQSLVKKA